MRNPVPDFTLLLTFMLLASFLLAVGIDGPASARLHSRFDFHLVTPSLAVRIDEPTAARLYLCFDFHLMPPCEFSRSDRGSNQHPTLLVF